MKIYHVEYLSKEIQNMEQNGYWLIQNPFPAPCIAGVQFLMNSDIGIIELAEIRER